MSVLAEWRTAKTRTNVVRGIGYVVGVVIGLPLAFAMLVVLLNGIFEVFRDPLAGLLMVAWSVAALGGYGNALIALQAMPRIDDRERRSTLWWVLAGCAAATPLAIIPPPILWIGLALVGSGLLLFVELILQDGEPESAAPDVDATHPAV